MAYIITKTNGDTLLTVPDTERNDDYSVSLVGKNYAGYGVFLNDNFVGLMENFANTISPARPVEGQLWYNTTTRDLNLWTGASWKRLSTYTAASAEPDGSLYELGNFWWDTTNYQLKVWTGQTEFSRNVSAGSTGTTLTISSTTGLAIGDIASHANISVIAEPGISQILNSTQLVLTASATVGAGDAITFTRGAGWYNIGPIYKRSQKKSGVISTDIVDTDAASHVVDLFYVAGEVVATLSKDEEFTPRPADAISGFSTVKTGFQNKTSTAQQLVRTVHTASTGALGYTTFTLLSNAGLQTGDFFISANLGIGAGAMITAIHANSAVTVSATTTVYEAEAVTFQRGSGTYPLYNGVAYDTQRLGGYAADTFARMATTNHFLYDMTIDGNISFKDGGTTFTRVVDDFTIRNHAANGNISIVANVGGAVANAAVLSISGNTGLAKVYAAPTEALGIATKGYVDSADGVLRSYITSNVAALVDSAPSGRQTFGEVSTVIDDIYSNLTAIIGTVNLRSTILSPAFTGVPTVPTAPAGTSNLMIASTAFVTTRSNELADELAATTATTNSLLLLKANIASPTIISPTFTGLAVAPTAAAGTNTTQIATTEFVNTTANATAYSMIHSVVPRGVILMWSGAIVNIPSGWSICDGTNDTPDLRSRFIVGAGSSYTVGNIGGTGNVTVSTAPAGSHSHTGNVGNTAITTAQMPTHGHIFDDVRWSEIGGAYSYNDPQLGTISVGPGAGSRSGSDSDNGVFFVQHGTYNTGSGQGHKHTISSDGTHTHNIDTVSILPPYYALAYIMKTTG